MLVIVVRCCWLQWPHSCVLCCI